MRHTLSLLLALLLPLSLIAPMVAAPALGLATVGILLPWLWQERGQFPLRGVVRDPLILLAAALLAWRLLALAWSPWPGQSAALLPQVALVLLAAAVLCRWLEKADEAVRKTIARGLVVGVVLSGGWLLVDGLLLDNALTAILTGQHQPPFSASKHNLSLLVVVLWPALLVIGRWSHAAAATTLAAAVILVLPADTGAAKAGLAVGAAVFAWGWLHPYLTAMLSGVVVAVAILGAPLELTGAIDDRAQQWWLETGLPGALLGTTLILLLLWRAINRLNNRGDRAAAFATIAVATVMTMISDAVWQLWWLSGLVFAGGAVIVACRREPCVTIAGHRHQAPLSVLLLIDSLDRGGAETHILRTFPQLDRDRVQVTVYTVARRGVLADTLVNAGVPVIAPPPTSGGIRGLFGAAWHLLRHLRRSRPDIVHAFLPRSYMVGMPVALLAGVPHRILSRRSLHTYLNAKPTVVRGLLGWLERRLHQRMDALLANAEAALNELAAAEGAPRDRLVLLYNGIDLDKQRPTVQRDDTRATLGLAEDEVALCIVANLIPYKGHADLLEACAGLPQGARWRLLMVGGDPHNQGALLHARAEELGIAAKIQVLGSRDDVPDLLAAADVGVLASHEEGFPNAVLEYMAAGLPVVATRAGGTVEAVADGTTGLLVPIGDTAALGAALERVIGDAALRQHLGEAGRQRVAECFSLHGCARAYETVYERVAAGLPPAVSGPAAADGSHARSPNRPLV